MPPHGSRIERALAGYFGSSAVPQRIPLLGATVRTLQDMSATNADAVTRELLFPSVSDDRRRTLLNVLHGASPTPETHSASSPTSLVQSSHTGSAPIAERTRAAALRATSPEASHFRLLTNRFSTVLDGDKTLGHGEEITYRELRRDVYEMWEHAQMAQQSLADTLDGAGVVDPTRPDRVVFVVAYSHTHGARGVGERLGSIQSRITALLHHRSSSATRSGLASILRVIPVSVGVQQRLLPVTTTTTGAKAVPADQLSYPHGGFYTLNALLHVIQSLPTATLRPHTYILSEGWLHPRTMALLHQQQGEKTTMEVVPSVVSDALSERESEAFARYVVCQMRHL